MIAAAALRSTSETPSGWGAEGMGEFTVSVILALVALWVLFIVLVLVRYWSQRMQKGRGVAGRLDLERLQAQRDAGQITPEEYEAVRSQVLGTRLPEAHREKAAPIAEAAPEEEAGDRPINSSGPAKGSSG